MPRSKSPAPTRGKGRPLNELTAVEAQRLLQSGAVSAVDYARACLARIAEREPVVQAWVHMDPDNVLAQARALDERKKSGRPIGPLHGLPVGLKDIIDTADQPTQNGSPIYTGYQPEKDATCVAALRAAGAVIMGKTVTTELATLVPNKTRNPHNPEHTPGGSSSGSAAAVADFMVPLALGTQTGGSVIRPASFCGIYGLKPTLGMISRTGVTLQSHTLDTVGVYGRSVEDLALVADALAQHDPSDAVSYPRAHPNLSGALGQEPATPPRLAFCRTHVWAESEPVTRDAFAALVSSLGSHVREVEIAELEAIREAQPAVMGAENAAYYGPLLERHPDKVAPALAERIRVGAKVTGHAYIRAINTREEVYRAVARVLTEYDAILCPASPGPAPNGLGSTGNAIFNALWTYLGVPCVTVPVLEGNGLPLGAQLVGLRRDEARLLRTARWLVGQLGKA